MTLVQLPNWYTNFAGNDGLNRDGDRAYSSYVEATAPFKLGGCDWAASIGAVPFTTSFYGDTNGFAVTNVSLKATKDLKITDSFSVQSSSQVAANLTPKSLPGSRFYLAAIIGSLGFRYNLTLVGLSFLF